MTDRSGNGSSSHSRAADIIISLSVGLLVGVAGTLLLAPASGGNTRRRIGELADKLVDKTGQFAHRAGDLLKDQAGRVEQAIVEGKQAYRQERENRPS